MTDAIFHVFSVLLNISITAGWIILALIALRLIFRRAPKRLLCDLWGLAALRLILPVSVQNPFSLIPSARFLQPDRVGAPYLFDTGIETLNESVYSALDSVDQIGYVSANDQIWLWLYRISFTWFVGVCVLLILAAVSYIRVHRSVRESVPVRDRVYLCDGVGSPFILGLFHPKIYIPAGTDEISLQYIEAHETAHIRRLDHIRKPIAYILLCVYWFQPLVWFAYYLFCRDVEGACDEYAIKKYSDPQRAAYAETLLRFSAPMKSIYSCPVAFGETGIKARIRSVVKYRKPARALIAAILIAACIFGFVFLSDPVSAETGLAKKYVLFDKTEDTVLAELTEYETFKRGILRVYAPDGTKTIRGTFSSDAEEIHSVLTDGKTGATYVFSNWIDSYSFLSEQSTGDALGAASDENEFMLVVGELDSNIDGLPGKEHLLLMQGAFFEYYLTITMRDGSRITREVDPFASTTKIWLDCDRSGRAKLFVMANFGQLMGETDPPPAYVRNYPIRLTDGEPELLDMDHEDFDVFVYFRDPNDTLLP